MKAAILAELKSPLIIDNIEVPDLTFGQVRVRICFTGICGSQIGEIDGKKGQDKYLPHLLGHEASGIVEEVGPHVTKVKEGDHVVLHWRPGSGIQAPTPKYQWNSESLNAGWVTTFQEQAIVSENRLTRISNNIDMEIASLYGCAVTTGFGSVINDAKIAIGQSVVIVGAGAVGLCAILGAKLVSAHPIIAIDIEDSKLEMAKGFGATYCINSKNAAYFDDVMRITEGKGADAVIETTGLSRVIETAYQMTASSGITVLVGVPPHDAPATIDTLPLHFEKRITGSHGGGIFPDRDIPAFLKVQEAGFFNLRPVITHRFTLDKINDAIELTRSGKAGRCIITF